MVRVGGLVIVGGMAPGTGIGGIGIVAVMAGVTIVFEGGMCSPDRVISIVVKGRR